MAESPDPDAELMLRVQRGDLAAFEQLIERYKQPVANLIHRTLGDATEAEDLAQNVFVQVYRSAPRYKVTARFSTWLFTIARNLCLNEIRRRSRHPTESMDQTRPGEEEHPARQFPDLRIESAPNALMQTELHDKLAEALAELPENQRTALVLYQQEELSYEDIGRVLDCSLSATKSLIFRARETLKRRLKPYLKTGSWTPGPSATFPAER